MIPVADNDISSVGFAQRNGDDVDISAVDGDADHISTVGFAQRTDCIVTGSTLTNPNPNTTITNSVDTCQSALPELTIPITNTPSGGGTNIETTPNHQVPTFEIYLCIYLLCLVSAN